MIDWKKSRICMAREKLEQSFCCFKFALMLVQVVYIFVSIRGADRGRGKCCQPRKKPTRAEKSLYSPWNIEKYSHQVL